MPRTQSKGVPYKTRPYSTRDPILRRTDVLQTKLPSFILRSWPFYIEVKRENWVKRLPTTETGGGGGGGLFRYPIRVTPWRRRGDIIRGIQLKVFHPKVSVLSQLDPGSGRKSCAFHPPRLPRGHVHSAESLPGDVAWLSRILIALVGDGSRL